MAARAWQAVGSLRMKLVHVVRNQPNHLSNTEKAVALIERRVGPGAILGIFLSGILPAIKFILSSFTQMQPTKGHKFDALGDIFN